MTASVRVREGRNRNRADDARRTDALPGAGETMAKKTASRPFRPCRRSEHVENPVEEIENPYKQRAFRMNCGYNNNMQLSQIEDPVR